MQSDPAHVRDAQRDLAASRSGDLRACRLPRDLAGSADRRAGHDLWLTTPIDPFLAPRSTATLDGMALTYSVDWTLDSNGFGFHLVGAACAAIQASKDPQLDVAFPCSAAGDAHGAIALSCARWAHRVRAPALAAPVASVRRARGPRFHRWRAACSSPRQQRRFNMKVLRDTLAALLVSGAALTAPAMTGCYASGSAYVVDDTPPPPREEVVVSRPGFVWIHGHWTRPNGTWAWHGGYYERERPNQTYVEGRWERRGKGHVWVDGGWRARASVTVREH